MLIFEDRTNLGELGVEMTKGWQRLSLENPETKK